MAIDYDQMKGWEEETQINFEELYIDDQDFVKLNGQPGPKNDAKHFLDMRNFETILRFLFKFIPDTEKPSYKRRLPTLAKQWYENSVYKEMFGLVSLEEMNESFISEQLNYINPIYVQRRMNDLYADKYNKKEKFSSGKKTVTQTPMKKVYRNLRGTRPTLDDKSFKASETNNFVDVIADKHIDNKYVYAEYGGEYHDYDNNQTKYDAGYYRETGNKGNVEYESFQMDGTYLENLLSRQVDRFNADIPPDTRDTTQYKMNKYNKKRMYRLDNIHRRNQENNIDETLPMPREWLQNQAPKFRNRELYYRFKEEIIDDRCADYDLRFEMEEDSCSLFD